MKSIYIPGLTTTYTELEKIEQMFLKEGLKINFLFENYSLLSTFRKKEIEEAINYYLHSIAGKEKVNLICHSIGCNFGVLAEKNPSVEKLVFVSPEFGVSSKTEKQEIKKIAFTKYSEEKNSIVHYDGIKERLYLTGLFLRSQCWALHQLKMLNKPIMVAYSEGDYFVSRNGIKRVNPRETLMLETALHNPFLGHKGPYLVKKIQQYLRKEE